MPLPALSFLEPIWIVAGLAGSAVALFAHLLVRRPARRIIFPAARLALEADLSRSRRTRPRDRALLALRVLIPLLIGLGFSQPRLNGDDDVSSLTRNERAASVIILDASASMRRLAPSGATLFDEARDRAMTLLDQWESSGGRAAVIIASETAASLLPEATSNISALRAALSETSATLERCDAAAALAVAHQLSPDAHARVVVLSDFQSAQWSALEHAPEIAHWSLTPNEGANSTAVLGLTVSPAAPVVGQPARVQVEVLNTGDQRREIPVTIDASGESFVERVTVEPNGVASVSVSLTFTRAGPQQLEARTPADAFPFDDVRRGIVEVGDHRRAAVLTASEGRNFAAPGAWIAAALGARAPADEPPDIVSPGGAASLAEFDQLIVVDAGAVADRTLTRMIERLRSGASVLWVLDSEESLASLRRLGAAMGVNVEAIEASAGERAPAPGPGLPLRALAPVQLQAPAGAPLWPGSAVTAQYSDGSPLLMRISAAAGTLTVLRTCLDPAQNGFVRSPLFPALIDILLSDAQADSATPAAQEVSAAFPRPEFAPDPRGGPSIAVNLAREESESSTAPSVAYPDASALDLAPGKESQSALFRAPRLELWPWALGAALALIICEGFLAGASRRKLEAGG